MKNNTIINDADEIDNPTRLVDLGVGSPSVYAFVRDEDGHIGLMGANKGDMFGKHDWIEVTDLSCIPVWEYKGKTEDEYYSEPDINELRGPNI